ncbi:MAG: hypothetical protein WCP28_06445 [Actinomycetes bacterium]
MNAPSLYLTLGAAALSSFVVVAMAVPPATASTAGHSVSVLGTTGKVVAEFTTAKCSKERDGTFTAIARTSTTGYNLYAVIEDFTGFGSYELGQDPNAKRWVSIRKGRKGVTYSNLHTPPFDSFGFGQIVFRKRGKLMGIGYSPAYAKGGTDAVTFTGVLTCQFPKKKRK